ncbi:hypothetical protein RHGRI_010799 [Rhododendron griersonianum]|uniref:Uncharacterized protein n=1 Tax=Rhododendron griersonianum TaxID=479676 RepID=A0AAV6KK91_9ERIC|nr:hypothetical protein RHGRI_010799 [Rhododendron griersonianum]
MQHPRPPPPASNEKSVARRQPSIEAILIRRIILDLRKDIRMLMAPPAFAAKSCLFFTVVEEMGWSQLCNHKVRGRYGCQCSDFVQRLWTIV